MKNLKINIFTIGLAAAGLGMTSCSDSFLDVSSKTESTTDNFYKTESDAWRALLGCYDGFRCVSSVPGVGFYCASTICSDEAFGGTGNGDGRGWQVIDRFDQTQSPSDLNLYETDWSSYYAAVYRCNEMIAHEEQIQWDETSNLRGTYMGECRGLRACLYFDMVRMWGNIPLYTEPVNENLPQSTPDEVYAVIVEDLQYAINNIPADAYPKANASSNDGHFTKFAAEALLARVYLFYTGYYGKDLAGVSKSDALTYCEDVISNSGCSLVPEYKDLWAASSLVPMADGSKGWDSSSTYAGEANSEVVFQMKFTSSQDYNGNNDSNRWQVMMGMRSLNSSPYGKGWGGCTVCPSFLENYEDGDLRLEASVIDMEGEGITSLDGWEASYKDWREYTGYTVKKYSPLCYADGSSAVNSPSQDEGGFQEQNPQNWVIMRLADVMLMAAELGSSNAQSYLDQIRSRAGLASVTATKENILKERCVELAFEGHRYWDLLRQGIDVAANTIAASSGKAYSGGKEDNVTISANNIKATNGLLQIPYNQIVLANGTITQKPGW